MAEKVWTERSVLDAMHQRFCRPNLIWEGKVLRPPRHVMAEHVRLDLAWPKRILDAVTIDTWRSGGYWLHGYEVKVSASDLRRELVDDAAKSAPWDQIVNAFTIVAPHHVLDAVETPEHWGLIGVDDKHRLRSRRAPRRGVTANFREREAVPSGMVASLLRSASYTAARRCSQHDWSHLDKNPPIRKDPSDG